MAKSKSKRENIANRKKRKREREEITVSMAEKAFKSGNVLGKDVTKNIKNIIDGKIIAKDMPYNSFYYKLNNNKSLYHENGFLIFVFEISKLKGHKMLEDRQVLDALLKVVEKKKHWVRKVSDWKKKTHNPHRQFSSLVRFLFCKYDIPKFMDKCWFNLSRDYDYGIHWFIDMGIGKNIKNSKHLPVNLTKKMSHEFSSAPSSYRIIEAFMWAQVKALGGDERLIRTLNGTSLRGRFFTPTGYDKETFKKINDKEDFGLTIIDFFVNNPMMDQEKVGPIIDYIYNAKYVDHRVIRDEDGLFIRRELINPNFSFKGRNPGTILIQTDEWHEELNRVNRENRLTYGTASRPKKWDPVDIKNYKISFGTKDKTRIYTITQLVTQNELSSEGRDLGHCVSSYANSCASKRCSIWSLKIFPANAASKRMVTIELDSSSNIVQVRGKHNRKATDREDDIIRRWSISEGLNISRWC